MNFIEYCIATKNYSTIKAIKDYSECRTFTEKMSGKKKATIAAIAAGVPLVTAAGLAAANPEEAGYIAGTLKNKASEGWDKIKNYFKGEDQEDSDNDDFTDHIADAIGGDGE